MLFRLTNALVTFQVIINNALQEYLDIFVTAYLDNIVVYTNKTLKEYIEHIRKILRQLV